MKPPVSLEGKKAAPKRTNRVKGPGPSQETVEQAIDDFIEGGGDIEKLPDGGPLADKLKDMEE